MSSPTRVLVVEDEAPIRMIIEYNLKLDGFEVFVAADGQAGLSQARQCQAELILLDWMMPGISGIDVLRQIRNDTDLCETPIFMLTAKGMDDDISEAFIAGADDYITKPFEPRQLGGLIKRKLEGLLTRRTNG